MLHLSHFLLILALAAGLASITLSLQMYRKYRYPYVLAINLMPALFFRWFLPVYVGERLSAERISEADASLLFQKYAISPREQEIIRLICKGKTNKEISGELFISLQTVKDHVYRIFGKTGVNNRVQLTNLFLRPEKD